MHFIVKFFSSYKATLVFLFVYAVGLALATIIEKSADTHAARFYVYNHPGFFLWQFLMVVHFVVLLTKRQLYKRKKWGFLLLHGAFILILSGALITYLFGREGTLHLREGESGDRMTVRAERTTGHHTFPFRVELVKFTLTRYPGSDSPSSYESEVLVHVDGRTEQHRIYMNKVLDIKGYRFFQASFDPDEKGSVLSVNKDVAGRNVTYFGYILLITGFILCLTEKNARFRQLARRLKKIHAMPAFLVPMLLVASLHVRAETIHDVVAVSAVPKAHAVRFGALPMQSYNGRMIPVNTFSSEVLRKLHKKNKIGKLNSDQFLISLLALPEVWVHVPFIRFSNKEIAAYYGLSEGLCAYAEAFDDDGQYKFHDRLEEIYRKMPADRNRFDKDLLALDEQLNILSRLFNNQLLGLFPLEDDPNHTWYAAGDDLSVFSGQDSMFVSRILDWYLMEVQKGLGLADVSDEQQANGWIMADEIVEMIRTYQTAKNKTLDINPKKIEAELRYNQWNLFNSCKKAYLIMGGLLLVLSFVALFRKVKWMEAVRMVLIAGVAGAFLLHLCGIGMRWYIAGYAPWSNSYETMVYVSWTTVLAGLLFIRRSAFTFALATLFGGIILFVSGLNWMNPQITPLVPVLKSPWLMFHVAVIVAAYGFFGISALIGFANLCIMTFSRPKINPAEDADGKSVGHVTAGQHPPMTLRTAIEELSIVNEMSLIIGLALMTIGTFLGAVWANESWGRYWGWDPKETWALITIIVYAIVIHFRLVRKWDNPWLLNLSSTLAFAAVLMTYFGVNYFLSGMHSYGRNDHIGGVFTYMYVAFAIVFILAIASYRGWKKNIHF